MSRQTINIILIAVLSGLVSSIVSHWVDAGRHNA